MALDGVFVTEVVSAGAVSDISSPVAGQCVFYAGSLDQQGFYYYNGTEWKLLAIQPL